MTRCDATPRSSAAIHYNWLRLRRLRRATGSLSTGRWRVDQLIKTTQSVLKATAKISGEMGTLTPPPPWIKTQTDRHQSCHGWLCRSASEVTTLRRYTNLFIIIIIRHLPVCKISSRSVYGFLLPICAKLPTKVSRLLFIFIFLRGLTTLYRLDACTDFGAQCVKRRRFAQGCAFWGSRKQIYVLTPFFRPPPPKKKLILGAFLTGLENFRLKMGLNIAGS